MPGDLLSDARRRSEALTRRSQGSGGLPDFLRAGGEVVGVDEGGDGVSDRIIDFARLLALAVESVELSLGLERWMFGGVGEGFKGGGGHWIACAASSRSTERYLYLDSSRIGLGLGGASGSSGIGSSKPRARKSWMERRFWSRL